MAELMRKAMMQAYLEQEKTEPTLFLLSFFSGEKKFDTESVEIDVQRNGRSVALDVQFGADGHLNEMGIFSNKEFTPPMYNEYVAVDAFSGFKRMPGEVPYTNSRSHWSRAIARLVSGQVECRRKILRALEFQARQILFGEAKVKLRYPLKGEAIIDFRQKKELRRTAAKDWKDSSVDAIGDVHKLCDQVRIAGKGRPKIALFGEESWAYFDRNQEFNKRLDQLHRNEGSVLMPTIRDRGAVYKGTFSFGTYELEMWVYPEVFDAPVELKAEKISQGAHAPWVPVNKVLVIDPQARREKVFGGVPVMQNLDAAEASLYGVSAVPVPAEYDFYPYIDIDRTRRTVHAGILSRPLLVPVAIDSFGFLITHTL